LTNDIYLRLGGLPRPRPIGTVTPPLVVVAAAAVVVVETVVVTAWALVVVVVVVVVVAVVLPVARTVVELADDACEPRPRPRPGPRPRPLPRPLAGLSASSSESDMRELLLCQAIFNNHIKSITSSSGLTCMTLL